MRYTAGRTECNASIRAIVSLLSIRIDQNTILPCTTEASKGILLHHSCVYLDTIQKHMEWPAFATIPLHGGTRVTHRRSRQPHKLGTAANIVVQFKTASVHPTVTPKIHRHPSRGSAHSRQGACATSTIHQLGTRIDIAIPHIYPVIGGTLGDITTTEADCHPRQGVDNHPAAKVVGVVAIRTTVVIDGTRSEGAAIDVHRIRRHHIP